MNPFQDHVLSLLLSGEVDVSGSCMAEAFADDKEAT